MELENIRSMLVEQLEDWIETMPDAASPMIGLAGARREALSPRDVLREVRDRTPRGEEFLESWCALMLEEQVRRSLGGPTDDDDEQASELAR